MKGKTTKTLLLLTTLLTCLLMLSTATALPVATSEPVMDLVEEQEQLMELSSTIEEIINSDRSLLEKKESLLQLINDFQDINSDLLFFILEFCLTLSFYLLIILNPAIGISINLIIAVFWASVWVFEDSPMHRPPDTIPEFLAEFVPVFFIFLVYGPSLSISILMDMMMDYLYNLTHPQKGVEWI